MAGESMEPTIHRRRLRSELRRAREKAGTTQRDVAAAMDWSLSKLIRIETGQVSITTNDLRALLTHYGINDQHQVDRYVDLARRSRERSWWSAYKDVASTETLALLSYESSAAIIRNFESQLVPGLLQTTGYAKAVVDSIVGSHHPERVDLLVELRKRRQELFERDEPPNCHFIVDEAVISRVVGGPAVMRRQLNFLLEMSERDDVTLRVVPFDVGVYPFFRMAYGLFEFPDPGDDPDILYIENALGEVVIHEDSPTDTDRPTPAVQLAAFFQLEQVARREDTRQRIEAALDRLPR